MIRPPIQAIPWFLCPLIVKTPGKRTTPLARIENPNNADFLLPIGERFSIILNKAEIRPSSVFLS
jgi:hypothetical protein